MTCTQQPTTNTRALIFSPFFKDWTPCHSSLMTLAAKYAIQLRTRSSDVVERLEELRQWVLQKDLHSHYTVSGSGILAVGGIMAVSNIPVVIDIQGVNVKVYLW